MTSNTTTGAWRQWDAEEEYGQRLFQRASGELPEMESSKAVATIVQGWVQPGDRILDVGCGAGHYHKSFRRQLEVPFTYTGVDATAHYIELARKAWKGDSQASFEVGDIFSLPFENESHDIVISCNMLLHLPSIEIPLRELVRVCRKHVLIRTLVGERSFRIQEVRSRETHPNSFAGGPDQIEFHENGSPRDFGYFNIFSKSYIEKLLAKMPEVDTYSFEPDTSFDPGKIAADASTEFANNATQIYGNYQVSGYILMPWSFIHITRRSTDIVHGL